MPAYVSLSARKGDINGDVVIFCVAQNVTGTDGAQTRLAKRNRNAEQI